MTESLIAKGDGGTTYKPHPDGWARIILADIHDEGMREYEYMGNKGKRREVRFVWQSEVLNEETGEPLEHSEWFTLSLSEKANLRKRLEAWSGKSLTDEQVENGVDIMKLVGRTAYANFMSKQKQNGGTKAVIASLGKLPKDMKALAVSSNFKRVKDRAKDTNGAAPEQQHAPPTEFASIEELEADEDELPF
jgi:hypothetical protein